MDGYKLTLAEHDGITLMYTEQSPEDAKETIHDLWQYLGQEPSLVAEVILHGDLPDGWKKILIRAQDIDAHTIDISKLDDSCLVIWDMVNVDIIRTISFIQYFEYYWYEACDDVFVLFPNKGNVCFIRHDGAIYVYESDAR